MFVPISPSTASSKNQALKPSLARSIFNRSSSLATWDPAERPQGLESGQESRARVSCFLENIREGGTLGDATCARRVLGWVGGFSSQPGHVLLLSSPARELLQRQEKKEGQRQQGDARLALNETPPGRGRCCAR